MHYVRSRESKIKGSVCVWKIKMISVYLLLWVCMYIAGLHVEILCVAPQQGMCCFYSKVPIIYGHLIYMVVIFIIFTSLLSAVNYFCFLFFFSCCSVICVPLLLFLFFPISVYIFSADIDQLRLTEKLESQQEKHEHEHDYDKYPCTLVLQKYCNLLPSQRFRVFISNGLVVGIN